MDSDFQTGFSNTFEEALRLMGQTVRINGVADGLPEPSPISALVDDSTGQTMLVKGGLEEQEVVSVTVWRTDFDASAQSIPQKQMTVQVDAGTHLLVTEVKNNRLLPYVVMQCIRYKK